VRRRETRERRKLVGVNDVRPESLHLVTELEFGVCQQISSSPCLPHNPAEREREREKERVGDGETKDKRRMTRILPSLLSYFGK